MYVRIPFVFVFVFCICMYVRGSKTQRHMSHQEELISSSCPRPFCTIPGWREEYIQCIINRRRLWTVGSVSSRKESNSGVFGQKYCQCFRTLYVMILYAGYENPYDTITIKGWPEFGQKLQQFLDHNLLTFFLQKGLLLDNYFDFSFIFTMFWNPQFFFLSKRPKMGIMTSPPTQNPRNRSPQGFTQKLNSRCLRHQHQERVAPQTPLVLKITSLYVGILSFSETCFGLFVLSNLPNEADDRTKIPKIRPPK